MLGNLSVTTIATVPLSSVHGAGGVYEERRSLVDRK
jgi:hypothetical protein